MNNKAKVIVIPGAFQYVKNYGSYDGVDIWLKGKLNEEKLKNADFIVAHSGGVNFVLTFKNLESQNHNFIFINPLIKKRSFLNLAIRDAIYLLFKIDNIKINKIVPISNWFYDLKKAYKLIKINVLEEIKKIPKENITIIKGKKDIFFCDKKAKEIVKKEGFKLIEVDAGHDWNKNIAETVNKIISNEHGNFKK